MVNVMIPKKCETCEAFSVDGSDFCSVFKRPVISDAICKQYVQSMFCYKCKYYKKGISDDDDCLKHSIIVTFDDFCDEGEVEKCD
jgi:hypothetical protein